MPKKEPKKLQVLGKFGKGSIEIPGGAKTGQMIVVKAVDENSKPTEWEAVDRTHYESVAAIPVSNDEITALVNEFDGGVTSDNHIIEGLTLRVIADGKVYDDVPIYNGCRIAGGDTWGIGDNYTWGHFATSEYGFCVSLYGCITSGDIDLIEVQRVSEQVKQLDEKFIPDTIARKTDIQAGGGMPGDTEQLALLIETDMLPAVHTNGAILTDQNGNIILRY